MCAFVIVNNILSFAILPPLIHILNRWPRYHPPRHGTRHGVLNRLHLIDLPWPTTPAPSVTLTRPVFLQEIVDSASDKLGGNTNQCHTYPTA